MSMTRPAELTLLLHPDCDFASIAAVLCELGWRRDPDRTNVATSIPSEPSFASWSRSYGDDGEVDYAFDPETGRRLLTLRGEAADARRSAISERLDAIATGETLADLTDALAPLAAAMAAGAGAETDDALRRQIARIGEGAARWELLRRVCRLGAAVPRSLLAVLIATALMDQDWRVRMTAMIAAGRFRLGDLAGAVTEVAVPPAEPGVLPGEDRRILLAARASVGDLLSEPPAEPATEPEIAAARAALRRRLAAFIRGEDTGEDTGETGRPTLLLTALTAPEELPPGRFPDQWQAWLPAASRMARAGQ